MRKISRGGKLWDCMFIPPIGAVYVGCFKAFVMHKLLALLKILDVL
jgi:hypothetical protein